MYLDGFFGPKCLWRSAFGFYCAPTN